MNLLDAMDDPALFGPHFRGASWTAWRAFLAALFALPLGDDLEAIYRRHTGRSAAPEAPFGEAALICGRRGGKSRILALIATWLATAVDYRPHLAPGEVATIAIIAADKKQARSIFRFIKGLLEDVALLAPLVDQVTTEAIRLNNRVVIEIHTCSFRVTRGYTLAAALCDETAFWRAEDTSANPDVDVLAALRPGLSNIPGSMLLLASSPYAKRGALYQAYRQHWGRDDSRVLVWRGTTAEMNPRISPAVISQAYEDDPQSAAAEYGAEFRDDISAFIGREIIDACTVARRYELAPVPGMKYAAFVDPSGGSSDSMTLAIAHRSGDIAVLDAVREARPPFSPEAVVRDFAGLLRSYNVRTVRGDRYAGEWPRERFRENGITYELSDAPKSDLYRDLLPSLNSGKVELLDMPRLAGQFTGLERRTSRAGRDSIDHAPGAHDDLANAVAGALLMASAKSTTKPARWAYVDFMGR